MNTMSLLSEGPHSFITLILFQRQGLFQAEHRGATNMGEILTAAELATILKISKWQVYELAKTRTRSGDERKQPLPVLRIGTSVRFRKTEVEAWLVGLSIYR